MGSILRAECTHCGYHTQLFTGGGLADCEWETAKAAVAHDKKASEGLKGASWFQIKRSAAVCNSCKKLTVAVDVTYQQTEIGKELYSWGVCPDCGGRLIPVSPDKGTVPCPKCGEHILWSQTGRWD